MYKNTTYKNYADLTDDAANLFDGGWRSVDRAMLIDEYGITVEDAEAICEVLAEYEKENPKEISIDNGVNFQSAEEVIDEIMERDLWDSVVDFMDDETRETVHREIGGDCTELEFLQRYLELARNNLIIG